MDFCQHFLFSVGLSGAVSNEEAPELQTLDGLLGRTIRKHYEKTLEKDSSGRNAPDVALHDDSQIRARGVEKAGANQKREVIGADLP